MAFESFLDCTFQIEPLIADSFSGASLATGAVQNLDEASTLLDEAAKQFPDEGRYLMLLRLRIASQRGDVEGTASIFESALAQGFSYANMERFNVLERVQDAPQIKKLLQKNAIQYRDFVRNAKGPVVIMTPKQSDVPPPLLLVFHGNGGRAEWEADHYRSATTRGWLVAIPQSVQPIFENRFIWGDDELAAEQIQRFFVELRGQHPFDESCVVLAGISKGADVAVNLTLTHIIPTRGFIALSASHPKASTANRERTIPLIDASRERGIRAYVIIGDQDTHSYAPTVELADLFKERNLPCELEIHAGLGHEYPPDFERSLGRGLQFILQSP